MKKINFIFCVFVILTILTSFSISVYAEDLDASVSVQNNTSKTEEVSLNQENSNEDDYKTKLEEALTTNQELLGIYDTWTSIISIILILVTVFGIAVPIYANIRIDKKIKSATKRLKKDQEEIIEKNLLINNALMLAASKEYWSSNEILNDILKEDKDNTYLHLLIGRNYFLQYEGENQPQNLDEEDLQNIEDAINHYLFVANHSNTEEKYYELGVIFPNSIIHELCILMSKLIEHSLKGQCANYHKLTSSVLKAIEKILGIKNFDDIANDEPTNVHIMNYIGLNHELAKSYAHFRNIKAREQYEYTLKLYSISGDLDYTEEIAKCKKALGEL